MLTLDRDREPKLDAHWAALIERGSGVLVVDGADLPPTGEPVPVVVGCEVCGPRSEWCGFDDGVANSNGDPRCSNGLITLGHVIVDELLGVLGVNDPWPDTGAFIDTRIVQPRMDGNHHWSWCVRRQNSAGSWLHSLPSLTDSTRWYRLDGVSGAFAAIVTVVDVAAR